jgi:hypothetical protein
MRASGKSTMFTDPWWIYTLAVVGAALPFTLVAAFVANLPGPRGR